MKHLSYECFTSCHDGRKSAVLSRILTRQVRRIPWSGCKTYAGDSILKHPLRKSSKSNFLFRGPLLEGPVLGSLPGTLLCPPPLKAKAPHREGVAAGEVQTVQHFCNSKSQSPVPANERHQKVAPEGIAVSQVHRTSLSESKNSLFLI